MPWVKLDDQFPDHPKVTEAGPDAGWLYVSGLCYSARYLTDGFIPEAMVGRLSGVRRAKLSAQKLVEARLWEVVEGGYLVHDYHDYNPSSSKVRDEREAAAERMRRGRSGERAPNTNGSSASPSPSPDVLSEHHPPTPHGLVLVTASPPATDEVKQVFLAWCESTGRSPTRTKLDDKRRKAVAKALRDYPIGDLLDSVCGWKNSPHHAGRNDRGVVYNELTLLLRDAAQVEKFRDLARSGPPIPGKLNGLAAWAAQS